MEIDFNGKVISQAKEGYNPTGHVIHGAIYAARKDVNAIFHSHTPDNVAVSTQVNGFYPASQDCYFMSVLVFMIMILWLCIQTYRVQELLRTWA